MQYDNEDATAQLRILSWPLDQISQKLKYVLNNRAELYPSMMFCSTPQNS